MTETEEPREFDVVDAGALDVIQRAEIDMQIATARRYPRDLARVKKRMMDFATLDEETAMSCFYTLKRNESGGGTKLIQGPGVRLAEIALACYGNLRAGTRIIGHDGKLVTAQGVCHDLEVNSLVSVESQRRITNKNGKTYNDDMIATTSNAAAAIAFRNAVFKVVPGALIKPVYEAARACAVGDATTLKEKRRKVFERFNAMGIEQKRVLRAIDKTDIENVGLEDLSVLIGLGTSIKDGDTTIDEAFPEERGTQDDARKIAAERIAKNLGYTIEQVLECFDAPNIEAALEKKFGRSGSKAPESKPDPKPEAKSTSEPADKANQREAVIVQLANETGYSTDQVREFFDSKTMMADIAAKYRPLPKAKTSADSEMKACSCVEGLCQVLSDNSVPTGRACREGRTPDAPAPKVDTDAPKAGQKGWNFGQ